LRSGNKVTINVRRLGGRRLLVPALIGVSLAVNSCAPDGQGTAVVSPTKESNIPPIPTGLTGKAAKRAAAPDGRPRGVQREPRS
jgi:hypothetical protein